MCVAMMLALVVTERVQGEERADHVAPFRLKGLDGSEFDSEVELAGRVTLVSYWVPGQDRATRCLKNLADLQEEYAGQGVSIVTFVSGEVDRSEVEESVRELELQFPVLLDPDRSVHAAFEIIVSPSFWFVDANQVRHFKFPGCRRDFPIVARANIDFLLGTISEEEREERIERKKAPRTKGTLGAPVRYRLAKGYLERGNRKAAMREFTKAWEMEPPLVAAGVDLGLMLLQDGENEAAGAILERAVELAPEDPRAMGAKGVALIRLGNTEEGADLLERALEHELAEPLLYYEMGRVSQSRGSFEEASRYFRTSLELLLKLQPKDEHPSAPGDTHHDK